MNTPATPFTVVIYIDRGKLAIMKSVERTVRAEMRAWSVSVQTSSLARNAIVLARRLDADPVGCQKPAPGLSWASTQLVGIR
jgi:hypothetical protein